MQVHLPTEISFLHNTRYYRLHLHYKRLYFWKGLKTNLATANASTSAKAQSDIISDF